MTSACPSGCPGGLAWPKHSRAVFVVVLELTFLYNIYIYIYMVLELIFLYNIKNFYIKNIINAIEK